MPPPPPYVTRPDLGNIKKLTKAMHPDEFVSLAAPRMFVSRADREGEAQQQQTRRASEQWQAESAEQQRFEDADSAEYHSVLVNKNTICLGQHMTDDEE
jgi:hypothetical protein